jgi:DNA-binding CsgD family transcriptional regulator
VGAQESGQRREVIGRAVRKLGFDELWYARLSLERTGPTPTRICIAYGDSRWHNAYVDRKLHEFDARLQPALRSSLPHRWDIGAMGQADATGSHLAGINELQAALRADGLRWGVMFCVAGPADKECSLVCLDSREDAAAHLDDELIAGVLLLAVCLHEFYTNHCAWPSSEDAPAPRLSARQTQILQRLASGLTDREIAQSLDLSLHGVDYHLRRLREHFNAHNRLELVQAAFRTRSL